MNMQNTECPGHMIHLTGSVWTWCTGDLVLWEYQTNSLNKAVKKKKQKLKHRYVNWLILINNPCVIKTWSTDWSTADALISFSSTAAARVSADIPPNPDDVSGQSLGWWGSAAWWAGRRWAGQYWRKVLPPTPVGTAGLSRLPPGWLVQTSWQVWPCSALAVSLDQSKSTIIHQRLPWGHYHLVWWSSKRPYLGRVRHWGAHGPDNMGGGQGGVTLPRSLPWFMVLDCPVLWWWRPFYLCCCCFHHCL